MEKVQGEIKVYSLYKYPPFIGMGIDSELSLEFEECENIEEFEQYLSNWAQDDMPWNIRGTLMGIAQGILSGVEYSVTVDLSGNNSEILTISSLPIEDD